MKLILSVLMSCLLITAYAGKDGKCRALAMSGGGDLGAYQFGVLKSLIYNLPSIETQWDVVSGVSAGTLNSASIAIFAQGQEKEYVDFAEALWNRITSSDIFEYWRGGIAAGVLGLSPSLLNNAPLRRLIESVMEGRTIQRRMSVGTCDANNAEYVVYTYEPSDKLPADIIDSLIASAAIDGVFPPVLRDGRTLVDGGSIWNTNIFSAVDGCREMGYDDKDIIIDYVLCRGDNFNTRDTGDFHSLKHLLNARDISNFYSSMADVERSKVFYPDVKFRYMVAPSE
jgi:predicted acylesterase/phospholipase RssA